MDYSASFYSQPSYVGGGFPVFSGSRRQLGGGILGSIARTVLPLAKRVGKRALKGLARHGATLATDVISDAFKGKNIAESIKTRGKQRLSAAAKEGWRAATSSIKPFSKVSKPLPSRKRSKPLTNKKQLPAKKRRRANF